MFGFPFFAEKRRDCLTTKEQRLCSGHDCRRLKLEQLEERALLSVLPEGLLDPSFGIGGVAILQDEGFLETAPSGGFQETYPNVRFVSAPETQRVYAVQPDGKIVVATTVQGEYSASDRDFGVARFNRDGTLDESFNSGGTRTTDFDLGVDIVADIAIQPDGKILVAGSRLNVESFNLNGNVEFDFALVRYNENGSYDSNFGPAGNGRHVVGYWVGADNRVRDIELQPDGKILVVGVTSFRPPWQPYAGYYMHLARYNRDGSLDDDSWTDSTRGDRFGSGEGLDRFGTVVGGFDLATWQENPGTWGNEVVYRPSHDEMYDKIYVVGGFGPLPYLPFSDSDGFQVFRYDRDGILDPTFGGGSGSVRTDGFGFGVSHTEANSVDRLLVGGQTRDDTGRDSFALAHYDNAGARDPTFGPSGNGRLVTKIEDTEGYPIDSRCSLVSYTKTGILAVGEAWPVFPAVVRYDFLGELENTFFIGDGEGDQYELPSFLGSDFWRLEAAFIPDNDGKLVVALSNYDRNGNGVQEPWESDDLVVARFLGSTQYDIDNDGVSTDEEAGWPGYPIYEYGDANHDGEFDFWQANVATLLNAKTSSYVTIESPDESYLVDVKASTASEYPEPLPAGAELPVGLFKYYLGGVDPGGATTVTYTLHSGENVNSFWKWGVEPINDPSTARDETTEEHWWEFDWDPATQTGMKSIAYGSDGFIQIIVQFVDGQRGDNDLTENGVIADPGAPAEVNLPPVITLEAESVSLNEGQTATMGGMVSDPNPGDSVTLSASIGTVTDDGDGTWSWSLLTSDGPNESQTVTVTASDGPLETSTSFSLVIDNVDPVAVLSNDGPVDEGGAANVTFSSTFDPSSVDTSTGFRYAYDFGNDGSFEIGSGAYAGGVSSTSTAVPAALLVEGPATVAVKGRIIDKDGGFTDYVTTITVNNVAPEITTFSCDATFDEKAAENVGVALSVAFTDPGALDVHTARIDWDDGSDPDGDGIVGETIVLPTGDRSFFASHPYTAGGIYHISIILEDDDTGSDDDTTLAVVTGAGVKDGVLQIVGTDSADHVMVNRQGKGLFKVHSSFFPEGSSRTFDAAAIDYIQMWLCDGDDHASIAGNIDTPSSIIGSGGNDHLDGGGGHSILIGGLGTDRIVGGNSDNILIGGTTDCDKDDLALLLLLEEWSSDRSYLERVENIRSGIGPVLTGTNVKLAKGDTTDDDGECDRLTGSSGLDWYFFDLVEDDCTDRRDNKKMTEEMN